MNRPGQSILLAGPMAVGKSSVARVLIESGFEAVSFGKLIQHHAALLGMDATDRSTLQNVGTEMHENLGAVGMVSELLTMVSPDKALVVDGIRHLDVLAALRDSLRAVFVYLSADEASLRQRWVMRGGSEAAWESAVSHEVESQQDQLQQSADLTVDTTEVEPAQVAQLILKAALRL